MSSSDLANAITRNGAVASCELAHDGMFSNCSRLEYGTKFCHESPTMDEDRVQRGTLAALNRTSTITSERSKLKIRFILSYLPVKSQYVLEDSVQLYDL